MEEFSSQLIKMEKRLRNEATRMDRSDYTVA